MDKYHLTRGKYTGYGWLYNWYVVNSPNGLARGEWRVPTRTDWTTLNNHVASYGAYTITTAADALKSTRLEWESLHTTVTDQFGFSILPAGRRTFGFYDGMRSYAAFWSSTEKDAGVAYLRFADRGTRNFSEAEDGKQISFSVRLVRNARSSPFDPSNDGDYCDDYIDIDGNCYRTIRIGTQVWMAENLRTTRYENGVVIPLNELSWSDINLRDEYEGGIVAYKTTDYIIIAAKHDLSRVGKRFPWGAYGTSVTTSTSLCEGENNTNNILAATSELGIAARMCVDYRGGGYADWVLPSRSEVTELYNNLFKQDVGDFISSGDYWSSSESSTNKAWRSRFLSSSISHSGVDKNSLLYVRPIRKILPWNTNIATRCAYDDDIYNVYPPEYYQTTDYRVGYKSEKYKYMDTDNRTNSRLYFFDLYRRELYNSGGTARYGTVSVRSPVVVPNTHKFCNVSTHSNHIIATDQTGIAWSWGLNSYGQLGDNTQTERTTPVSVCGGHTFCCVITGRLNSYAIALNGQGWAWGSNSFGNIGDNTTSNRSTPTAICGGHFFCSINAGVRHAVALDEIGKVWAWGGNNVYGHADGFMLGDGTFSHRSTPVAVCLCNTSTFCLISSNMYHSFAIDINGMAWAWGLNVVGMLGDNTTTDRCIPVSVWGGHTFCFISAGYLHSLAIDINGKAWAWGSNSNGRLGDNTVTQRNTPVGVCGGHTFCSISAGYNNSFAVDYRGKLFAWGTNSGGVLGDNTATNRSTPVVMCSPF